ncbi:MAG: flagellar basal body L-ring protein FlgH [Vicinamibacterales bacterium]
MNRRTMAAVALCSMCLVVEASAQDRKGKDKPTVTSDNYDELYERYLQAARGVTPASAGKDISWMTGLASDLRARHVNDLVTIRVVENTSATGTADSNLDKSSSGGASITKLFGIEKKIPGDPSSLVGTSANTKFKGAGTTSRSSTLTAMVTARVVEVLPNGDLVLEGAREIDINGDRQIAVLTGVLRPSDIQPSNVALSSSVGQLRIRYFGKGLMKDNLQPGWLIRALNKIF